jgi:ParB-like chromosome segregation protein Spo0J
MNDTTIHDQMSLAPADPAGAADATTANGTAAVVTDAAVPQWREVNLSVQMIRIDGGTQPRADIDRNIVAEYAADLKDGAEFPPVDVFYDGTNHWLADGFHRLHAHRQAGREAVRAIIHQGTQSDAQWHGYAANRDHGLRRTNADKERAVRAALEHPKATTLSDQQIAEHVGVSREYVCRSRKHLVTESQDAPATRTVTRRGKRYEMNVAKIGKRSARTKPKSAPLSATAAAATTPAPASDCGSATTLENGAVRRQPATRPPQARVTDEEGRVIESEDVIAAFAGRPEFKALMSEVSGLKNKFRDLTQRSGGAWAAQTQNQRDFEVAVSNAQNVLRFSMPYAVCPLCGGAKCAQCKNTGWMPETVYERVPSGARGGK